jgi:hypothetical protein
MYWSKGAWYNRGSLMNSRGKTDFLPDSSPARMDDTEAHIGDRSEAKLVDSG